MSEIPPRLSSALASSYRFERELGKGGMATVYLAEDVKHRRMVAVKVLRPELAQAIGPTRFTREIEICASLTHPHILMLIDSGEADGSLFYVMPYVDGESLRERLDREGKLPVLEAMRIIDQVASALAYAHERGVIHRDIKPENILLAGDQAIVADFGIARAVEAAGGERLTGTGIVVGTPAYMSPEQAFGPEAVDGRSDVYAMGCVLFEMLAGRPPFRSALPQGLLAQHAATPAPSLRTLDAAIPLFVDRAVARSLAKEPEDRFQGPAEFAGTLRAQTVVAPVGRKRLAVLPPVNITSDPEQQFLVLGLHEALISQLGQGDVAVLARTSVLQYEGTQMPVKEICRELAVDAVVESSLFRAGDAVGVQARLVDGNTEEGLWSGSYDADVANVFSLYREVSSSIAKEIHGALGPRPRRPTKPDVDPVAYEKYMRGRVHQQSFNPHDLDRALQYYRAALEIQPDYAPAYAGMSLIWGSKAVLGLVPATEAGPRWRETAARAVELDPGWPRVSRRSRRATPGSSSTGSGPSGRTGARSSSTRTSPSRGSSTPTSSPCSDARRRATRRSSARSRSTRSTRSRSSCTASSSVSRVATRRRSRSSRRSRPTRSPRSGSPGRTSCSAIWTSLRHWMRYFELLGDREVVDVLRSEAPAPRAAMIRAAETLVERAEHGFVKPNKMIQLFAWGGDTDRALEWIERSWEMRDHEIAYLGAVPFPDELRGDPRFHDVLRRLNLPLPDGAVRS